MLATNLFKWQYLEYYYFTQKPYFRILKSRDMLSKAVVLLLFKRMVTYYMLRVTCLNRKRHGRGKEKKKEDHKIFNLVLWILILFPLPGENNQIFF